MYKDLERYQPPKQNKQSKEESKRPEDSIFYWLSKDSDKSVNYQKNLVQLSRDLIHNRYYDTFNFYFSKPINELLVGARIPHVIDYKEFLYYDDETEYLKRFYKRDEVKARIVNITTFYNTMTEGNVRTNFPLLDQFVIIQKRNEQHNKIILSKFKNLAEMPQTQRDSNNNLNGHEDALRNGREGPKLGLIDKPEKKPQEVENLPAQIPIFKKSEELIERETKSKEKEEPAHPVHTSFQQILPNQEDLGAVSFESIRHDIYHPNFSIEEPARESPEPVHKNAATNHRKDIKGDAFLLTPPVPQLSQLSGSQLKKMQKNLLQAELEENAPQINGDAFQDISPLTKLSANEAIMLLRGNKNDLRGGREFSKEKFKEEEKKIEYSLTSSVSFSKKEIFSNSSRHNDSESKSPKPPTSTFIKDTEKPHEEVLSDKQLVGSFSPQFEEKKQEIKLEVKSEKMEVKETITFKEQVQNNSPQRIASEEKPAKAPLITVQTIQINKLPSQQTPIKESERSEESLPRPVTVTKEIEPIHQISQITKPQSEFKSSPDLKQNDEAKTSHDIQNSSDKASPEIQSKPAETIFSEESSENIPKHTDTTPKTSSEHVKDLFKKVYKLSKEGEESLSQPITERFKGGSIMQRLADAKKKVNEPQPLTRGHYKNTSLRSSISQASQENGNGVVKGKNNTEANIFNNIAIARSQHMHHPSLYNYNTHTNPRITTSPSPNSKRRMKSNEGVFFTTESSMSNPMSSRRSPETVKSIGEFQNMDFLQGFSKNYEAVRMLEQKKAENKHPQHNKSKSTVSFLQPKGNLKVNPTIDIDQLLPGEVLISGRSPQNNYGQPSSNKMGLKLDLGHISPRIDTNLGLLSSKSGRLNTGRSPTDRYAMQQASKEYFLSQKYNKTEESQGYLKTDESKSRDITGSLSKLGFSTDRNVIQSPKNQETLNKNYRNAGMGSQGYNNGAIYTDSQPVKKKMGNSSRTGSISYQNKPFMNGKGAKY